MPDELTARARAMWSLGRYDRIAPLLEPAAEALCDAAHVGPGTTVLDVAAGTGNVALAAAARGAEVVASDVSPHLIERGRARTGDRVPWFEADARELPFEDGRFDVVLSCFGAVFAAEPERVAAELLRVARPGGVVALTAWVPEGMQAGSFRIIGRHLPSPPGASPPDAWGVEVTARERLAGAAAVEFERRALRWRFDGGADEWLAHFEEDAPPIVAARGALGDRWPQVRLELRDAVQAGGRVLDDGTFVVEPPYLVITARARG